MTKTAEEYLKEPYSRILIPEEDGGFSSEILEFPGCYSQGETAEEAYRNLEETAKSWIETCLAQGQDIPAPAANQECSGKFALRLPKSLQKQAARIAERDGVSLNQFFVSAISEKIGGNNMGDKLYERLANLITDRQKTYVTVVRSEIKPDWRDICTKIVSTSNAYTTKLETLVEIGGRSGNG